RRAKATTWEIRKRRKMARRRRVEPAGSRCCPMVMRPDTRKAEILRELGARARDQLPDPSGEQVERFLQACYSQVTLEELAEREVVDLYGAAMAHWRLLRRRQPAQ